MMDESEALRESVQHPAAIWCYSQADQGVYQLDHREPPADLPFRWLHLNMADQRSLRWLDTQSGAPPRLLAVMHGREGAPRFEMVGDALAFTIHDFERDFELNTTNRVGALHVMMRPGLLITGRIRPLRGADLVRAQLEQGPDIQDATQALSLLLDTHIDGLAGLVADLGTQLLEAETELMEHDHMPDSRELMGARRLSAQLHRMTVGLRATMQRMEREPRLPESVCLMARNLLPRLVDMDTDIVAAQHHLRQLRDELDLQAAQRTNENVYLLSVLTALMMPATLVTGFFGMNTGGLPFAQGASGTFMATLVALLAGALTWWLLRIMGLVRRK
ncbi:CorA family divalent cation transporter [Novosphingobium rosa]|uniref:CorA family divalent cation transporter n=1 Tax=Novosphingobium rosa TaxID=76978 RepID=UPI0008368220|nr:CorA family divalent cation transporter [Novosphingobium rosa]